MTQSGGKLKVTLAQRKVLLERLRRDVETVVEDLAGTGETLRILAETKRRPQHAESEAVQLIRFEQERLQGELRRLWDEYATLEYRRGGRSVAAA